MVLYDESQQQLRGGKGKKKKKRRVIFWQRNRGARGLMWRLEIESIYILTVIRRTSEHRGKRMLEVCAITHSGMLFKNRRLFTVYPLWC